jgi:hypothetical protein
LIIFDYRKLWHIAGIIFKHLCHLTHNGACDRHKVLNWCISLFARYSKGLFINAQLLFLVDGIYFAPFLTLDLAPAAGWITAGK